jgi:Na+/pantothenate symporter
MFLTSKSMSMLVVAMAIVAALLAAGLFDGPG